jgi:hypothetical protein
VSAQLEHRLTSLERELRRKGIAADSGLDEERAAAVAVAADDEQLAALDLALRRGDQGEVARVVGVIEAGSTVSGGAAAVSPLAVAVREERARRVGSGGASFAGLLPHLGEHEIPELIALLQRGCPIPGGTDLADDDHAAVGAILRRADRRRLLGVVEHWSAEFGRSGRLPADRRLFAHCYAGVEGCCCVDSLIDRDDWQELGLDGLVELARPAHRRRTGSLRRRAWRVRRASGAAAVTVGEVRDALRAAEAEAVREGPESDTPADVVLVVEPRRRPAERVEVVAPVDASGGDTAAESAPRDAIEEFPARESAGEPLPAGAATIREARVAARPRRPALPVAWFGAPW